MELRDLLAKQPQPAVPAAIPLPPVTPVTPVDVPAHTPATVTVTWTMTGGLAEPAAPATALPEPVAPARPLEPGVVVPGPAHMADARWHIPNAETT